jgi:hypothetical protein
MAEQLIAPYSKVLVASAVVAATGSSPAITLPLADGYLFQLDVTASNTPTSLDVAMQWTPDGGTTWYDHSRFGQVLAVAPFQTRMIIQPLQGRGEAATTATNTTDALATALIANAPISTVVRFRWKITGTSYTFSISMLAQARATAV